MWRDNAGSSQLSTPLSLSEILLEQESCSWFDVRGSGNLTSEKSTAAIFIPGKANLCENSRFYYNAFHYNDFFLWEDVSEGDKEELRRCKKRLNSVGNCINLV